LEAAARVLSSSDPDIALDTIAREAGVGIGTLYRNFPTREALIEAAYRNEVDQLCAAAAQLLGRRPPDVALREWMNRFVTFMIRKHGMADALRMVVASGADPFAHSRAGLQRAVAGLLDAAVAAGTVRADLDADDVLKAVSGICLVTTGEPGRAQAGRLLDLLMDGLRAGAPAVGEAAPIPVAVGAAT
jgi:AcrR family transcriptional regulator